MIASDKRIDRYIEVLIDELKKKRTDLIDVNTIYIGGGTPSHLGVSRWQNLFEALLSAIEIKKIEEFTVECNVEDITEDLLMLFRDHFVSRISLGIQSFNERKIRLLNRHHTKDQAIQNARLIRSTLGENISLSFDLIYGVMGETIQDLKEELDHLLNLSPDHVSIYSLILEEKTILHRKWEKDEYIPLDEDLESAMFFHIKQTLEDAGYVHYETSNFAKPGKQSKHNMNYWNLGQYLGLGAGASSHIDHIRWTNPRNLNRYEANVQSSGTDFIDIETLETIDQMKEELIVGLRKINGIDLSQFYRTHQISAFEQFPVLDVLLEEKWLVQEDEMLRIATDKLYMANHVFRKLI